MAINKNSNAFTFGFAIAMVIIVGVTLAAIAMGLKERQEKNKADKQMMDVLGAIGFQTDDEDAADYVSRQNAAVLFGEYVVERYSLSYNGDVIDTKTGPIDPKDKMDPFNIDVQKEYKSKIVKTVKRFKKNPEGLDEAMAAIDTKYPLYKCVKDGETLYVVPMSGTGLWGPIWGYVALKDDYKTISGAKFDHKGETPGLGAEIKEQPFQDKFVGKVVSAEGNKAFAVMKSGTPNLNNSQVDGITGGTITSVGVGEMLDRSFKIYARYFNKQ